MEYEIIKLVISLIAFIPCVYLLYWYWKDLFKEETCIRAAIKGRPDNTTPLIGASYSDIREAYQLGVITKADMEWLHIQSPKPKKPKAWVSYMPRPWRDDYVE